MNCDKTKEQLISYLLDTLHKEEKEVLGTHIDSCPDCQQALEILNKERNLFKQWVPAIPPYDSNQMRHGIMSSVRAQKSIEEKSSKELLPEDIDTEKKRLYGDTVNIRQHLIWESIKSKKVIITAMAAMIVVTLLLVINLFTRQSTESIAWAHMIEKIEKIGFYQFQLTTSILGEYEDVVIEKAKIYCSVDYGILSNRYFPGVSSFFSPAEYSIIEYGSLLDNTFITAYPEIKKYTRFILPEKNVYRIQEFDLVPYLKMLSSFDHKKLESKIIDGKEVVGFEIIDPKFGKEWSEINMAQIWIDTDTTLPVLYEFMGTGKDKLVMGRTVVDKFEWYETDDAGIFEPDFSEYQLVAEIEVGAINEETVILTLQRFAEVAKGRYPMGLRSPVSLLELKQRYRKRAGGKNHYWEEEDFEWEDYAFLFSHLQATGRFYGDLFLEYEDVAYHGKVVTTNDPRLPLLRWKISDDEYRVLFGDLRIEDVSQADLAEMEVDLDESQLLDPLPPDF